MISNKNHKLYKIINSHKAEMIVDQLEKVTSIYKRGKGLLGRERLDDSQALWISPCNNIHTFFMKFSIDCIFLDKKMVIQKTKSNIKPYRVAGPFWKSYSVIEFQAGTIEKYKLSIGDQLYVVS